MAVGNAAFDVIVVGAGPAGSAVAERLARASLRVALLEEHASVGLPDHCSGLVSPRTLELAGVDGAAVERARFSRARVWGPSGGTLWLESNTVQAVAIDRPAFDRLLAERAASAGAVLMLGTRAQHFARLDGRVQVEVQTERGVCRLHAPLLVGAEGVNSRVARWIGSGYQSEIVPVIKAEVAFRGPGTDVIEIFFGNEVAPGFFAWAIPVGDGQARIGLGATASVRRYYAAFLGMLRDRFGDFDVLAQRGGLLTLGPARGLVADRVMLVGGAACQTKPTTGGGIYFGLRAAALAAETALEAVERGDFSRRMLSRYEQRWRRHDGLELMFGRWLRGLFVRLSDRDFDVLIRLLSAAWVREQIARWGDIDFPSRLFGAAVCLKRTAESDENPVGFGLSPRERLGSVRPGFSMHP